VNINTADANTLSEQLDGVGASRAAAIVRYREQFGPFETVDELTNVSGIGSSILASNKDRLTVE
jgi:competence protein ComEA